MGVCEKLGGLLLLAFGAGNYINSNILIQEVIMETGNIVILILTVLAKVYWMYKLCGHWTKEEWQPAIFYAVMFSL